MGTADGSPRHGQPARWLHRWRARWGRRRHRNPGAADALATRRRALRPALAAAVALGLAMAASGAAAAAPSVPWLSCQAGRAAFWINAAAWNPPRGAVMSVPRVGGAGFLECGRAVYVPLALLLDTLAAIDGTMTAEAGPPKTLAIDGGMGEGPVPGGFSLQGEVVTVVKTGPGGLVDVRLSNGGVLLPYQQGDEWQLRADPPCAWCHLYTGRQAVMVGFPDTSATVDLVGAKSGQMSVLHPVRDIAAQ